MTPTVFQPHLEMTRLHIFLCWLAGLSGDAVLSMCLCIGVVRHAAPCPMAIDDGCFALLSPALIQITLQLLLAVDIQLIVTTYIAVLAAGRHERAPRVSVLEMCYNCCNLQLGTFFVLTSA